MQKFSGPPRSPPRSDDAASARKRRDELQRILPLWPSEIADLSLTGRRRVVMLLARALREERRRARGGHWAYDLARHAALARLYRSEAHELARLTKKVPGKIF